MNEFDELIAEILREETDTQVVEKFNPFDEGGYLHGLDKIEDEDGWEIESLDEYDLDEYNE